MSIFKARDMELSHTQVSALGNKPCPALRLAEDLVLGPVERGSEAKMPIWAAEFLAEKGILEIKDPKSVASIDLSKALWKEERTSLPSKLDESFYPRVRQYLRSMQARHHRQSSSQALREEEQARQNLQDLLRSRIQKILQVVIAATPPSAALENLTPEETQLYTQMRGIVGGWLKDALDIDGS